MNIVAIAGDNNRLTGFCSDGTVITTWKETASWTDFKMPGVYPAELPESVRPVEDGGEEYVFSDPAIEHAVKAQLGKNIDVVHAADLADITSLNLMESRQNINDMSSLYDMPNLTALDMSHGDISDISALSGMTKMSNLNLGINQISDLNPLSGMTTLEDLELKDNPISDRSPVAGLENTVDIDWSATGNGPAVISCQYSVLLCQLNSMPMIRLITQNGLFNWQLTTEH